MSSSDPLQQPLATEELGLLENMLSSEQTPDASISSVEMLDGYMTALVVGPERVPPDLWLPDLWNSENPDQSVFESEEEAETITSLLFRHLNSIARQFETKPDGFLPLYEKFSYPDREERALAIEDWSLGFVLGMELTYASWEPLFKEDENAILTAPMFILGKITEDHESMPQEEIDTLTEMLPDSVVRIYLFWNQPG